MGKLSIGTYMMYQSVDDYNKKLVVLYEPEFSIGKKDGYNQPHYSDLWISVAASFVVMICWHICYYVVRTPLYHLCKEKKDETLRIIKTDKASDKVFSFVYFVIINIYGYKVLLDTPFLPPMMGGSSDFSKMWTQYPYISTEKWYDNMKFYYLVTLGYHINAMRVVIWAWCIGKSKNDWCEMTLHHMLTIILYAFSYIQCFVEIGALIMFLHDWSDIWSPFTKIWVETDYKKLTVFGAAMTWITWVYSRIIIFPQIIYFGVFCFPLDNAFPNWNTPGHLDKEKKENAYFFMCILGAFLSFLQILHIYWIHMLTKSISKVAFGGLKEVIDPQERTEDWVQKKKQN